MNFLRGMRDKISRYVDTNSEICIELNIEGPSTYDFCCFGIDKSGNLSDDRYMIFYNQTSSPNNEINFVSKNNISRFNINLSKLPLDINKLVFTASIDGNGTMDEISKHNFYLSQNNNVKIFMELSGSDFKSEKAIISIEIYRKDEWRIAAIANGFNGGLYTLLAAFGGTEIFSDYPEMSQNQQDSFFTKPRKSKDKLTQEVMCKISLSKDKINLEKHVVNLSKCIVCLEDKNDVNLGSTNAKVVAVLDYSSSMGNLYSKGVVQRTINRLVPLGLAFDNNNSLDVYLFQNDYRKLDNLTLFNYENYVKDIIIASDYSMGGTNYAPVLKAIIEGGSYKQGGFLGFNRQTITTKAIVDNEIPTFVLFITDGENSDKTETDKIIKRSSDMNIFIQFIGIGNKKFKYLKQLDNMLGRNRDNTGFSKMKDLDNVDDNELYTNVLSQFSKWLKGLQ